MPDTVKTLKERCKCEHCGNEADMVVTCSLPEDDTETPGEDAGKRIKGTATCSHCGNEADMWVDL